MALPPTRRAFLRSSSLALVSFGLAPRALLRAAGLGRSGSQARRKVLVVVLQRGACDGLNTVVPYGDGHYRGLRPTIAVPAPDGGREAALDLNGYFGLHPALEPLLPYWRDRRLAVVQAVGSPHPTRSHFDAQDFLESGTPGRKATDDGWLNRSLLVEPERGDSPLRAVSITPTTPRILSGRAPVVSMASLSEFALRRGQARQGFDEMYARSVSAALRGAGRETFEALEALASVDTGGAAASRRERRRRGGGNLAQALGQVAALISSQVGLELAFVETGGWDHHAAEGGVQGQLAGRLRELAQGLSSFASALGPRLDDVLLVTLTEFGRTARENGNRGTDHGHASLSLLLGGGVRGGRVHGRWPGLAPADLYEGRDLAVTTDFRDLLGELLTRHAGLPDLRPVFPGHDVAASRFPGVLRA